MDSPDIHSQPFLPLVRPIQTLVYLGELLCCLLPHLLELLIEISFQLVVHGLVPCFSNATTGETRREERRFAIPGSNFEPPKGAPGLRVVVIF